MWYEKKEMITDADNEHILGWQFTISMRSILSVPRFSHKHSRVSTHTRIDHRRYKVSCLARAEVSFTPNSRQPTNLLKCQLSSSEFISVCKMANPNQEVKYTQVCDSTIFKYQDKLKCVYCYHNVLKVYRRTLKLLFWMSLLKFKFIRNSL